MIRECYLNQGHCGLLQSKATDPPPSVPFRAPHTGLGILGHWLRADLLLAKSAWKDVEFKWALGSEGGSAPGVANSTQRTRLGILNNDKLWQGNHRQRLAGWRELDP